MGKLEKKPNSGLMEADHMAEANRKVHGIFCPVLGTDDNEKSDFVSLANTTFPAEETTMFPAQETFTTTEKHHKGGGTLGYYFCTCLTLGLYFLCSRKPMLVDLRNYIKNLRTKMVMELHKKEKWGIILVIKVGNKRDFHESVRDARNEVEQMAKVIARCCGHTDLKRSVTVILTGLDELKDPASNEFLKWMHDFSE